MWRRCARSTARSSRLAYWPSRAGRSPWPGQSERRCPNRPRRGRARQALSHRAELVVDALDMAAALGRLEPGCVIHSDRGSEYTSRQLRTTVGELGNRQSMGRTASCFDNAVAESFWAVLKEEIGTRFWPDRTTARADIFNFIETFYNRRRLRKHIHWGYLTPHETRLRYR
ncbi:DDE-type integrase/transposase/recombinase [Streptomyces niveus]|uniref:DDE-type integrase/transposase/recombinase n=1 Tax=Streptomyces niveus TaxID=193462 RepID=UPI0036E8454D